MDEDAQASLRSDITLFLGTQPKGQWYTASQLYDRLGIGGRPASMRPEEFGAFLHELAGHKVLARWKSPVGGAGEMYGLP